jgi:hypothetical protein
MKRVSFIAAVVAALAVGVPAAGAGGPVTKQNGSAPVFKSFVSICGVPGFAFYGFCGGDTTRYGEITGRINAVQAKEGRWNLGFTFTNLMPGATYMLWGNQSGATPVPGVVQGFFVIGETVAAADGTARFSYQTTNPTNLGFDLNIVHTATIQNVGNITLVTSWWSNEAIQVMNADGTLYVPGS